MRLIMTSVLSVFIVSCGGTDFAASNQPARQQPVQQQPQPIGQPPINSFQPIPSPPYNPSLPSNPPIVPVSPAPVLRPPGFIQPNSDAVQRGSFTVWTDPKDPAPGQFYDVIIEVKFASNITNYRESDLTGCIIGTDEYAYALGRGRYAGSGNFANCSQLYAKSTSDFSQGYRKPSFKSGAGIAQLRIPIPGAEDLVRDRIEIRSTILNESQVVTIEF